MYNIVRKVKTFINKCKYKLSPKAVKMDVTSIIQKGFFESPHETLEALEDYAGVIDYKYDSKGNFDCTLANGLRITIKTEVEEVIL